MPLVYRKEPADAGEAMRSGLKQMAAKGAFLTPLLRQAVVDKAEEPLPGQALPVYHLGLSDLAEDKDARSAVHSGWRYAIRHRNKIIAHGETIIDPTGLHHFAAINEGPLVQGTSRAIEAAEEQDVIKKGNYEVRLLFVPALHVAALWLADKNAGQDYAIPIEPTPPPLVPNMIIPFQDFMAILQEKAKSVSAELKDDETIVGS